MMPLLFGDNSSPFDEYVEKATAETVTNENWGLIVSICDKLNDSMKAGSGSKEAKQALLSVKKRLSHRDPHVVMLSLSVLDSLWSNCGETFRREVSSKEFTSELLSKATNSNRSVGEKTRLLIKKWTENECKTDVSLSLIIALYNQLHADGYSFESSEPKKRPKLPTDANFVSSAAEEEAIAKAIELSLKEGGAKKNMGLVEAAALRTVKALYDFEAAEDNELTFLAGDVITVLTDSDANWWKGRSHRGEGLFPASFVSSDMSAVTNNHLPLQTEPKSVQFDDDVQQLELDPSHKQQPKVDEQILIKCLDMLRDADPTGERPDPPEMDSLEADSLAQIPLIDEALAEVDRRHNMLAEVDVKMRDVLALYDSAMQQATSFIQGPAQMVQYGSQTEQQPVSARHQQPPSSSDPSARLAVYVPQIQSQQPHTQQPYAYVNTSQSQPYDYR